MGFIHPEGVMMLPEGLTYSVCEQMLSTSDMRHELITCFGCAGRCRGEEDKTGDMELQGMN